MAWRPALPLAALLAAATAQSLANSFFAETGTNAGFYTSINQKGLDLMADYLQDRVIRFLTAGDLQFNISSSINNDVRLNIVSQKLSTFEEKLFASRMESQPGKGLQWTGSNLNATVITTFAIATPAGEISGTAPFAIEKADVEFLLWTGVNADGHLKTDLVTCKVSAGVASLRFEGNEETQLGAYYQGIQDYLRDNIEQVVCPTFHAELVPVLSNRLMNTPMSAALFDQYFLNYGLLGPVQFEENKILLKHRGNAFGILRQGRTRLNDFRLPFRAGPLASETDSGRMVDIVLSNYTLSSLLFWMDQYRKFDYEISQQAQNNSAITGYLRTECPADDICAGTIFPALKERFPAGMVVIKSHTISYPRLVLEEGKATVYVDSRVDAFVQQGDRNRRFLTATMAVEVKLDDPRFKDYVFKATMRIDKFKIAEVASLVEGIDENSLEFLVNALTELILNENMAGKLKGVSLPIIFDFEQAAADVVIEKDRVRISADYCYGSRCQVEAAESKDGNVDYYDQVSG